MDAKRGGCLCGAVRYEVTAPLRPVVVCHCGMCLKTHGGPAPYTATEHAGLRFLEESGLAWYESSPDARRGFCTGCGASLFYEPRDPAKTYISLTAGSLDAPSGLATRLHIHLDDKGDWYALPEGAAGLGGGHGGLTPDADI